MNVYSFEELSETAQEYALEQHHKNGYYPWYDDNRAVLEEFERIFDVTVYFVSGYDYKMQYTIHTNFQYDEDEFTGIRLLKYLQNNYMQYFTQPLVRYSEGYKRKYYSKIFSVVGDCPLTGYYLDQDILDPILKFVARPTNNITLHELLCKCIDKYQSSAQKDLDFYYSKEYFAEECSDRGSLFFENGSVYDMDPMH